MTTITKEFAQDIIKGHGYGVAPSAVEALARIALASLDADADAGSNSHPATARSQMTAYTASAIFSEKPQHKVTAAILVTQCLTL